MCNRRKSVQPKLAVVRARIRRMTIVNDGAERRSIPSVMPGTDQFAVDGDAMLTVVRMMKREWDVHY